MANSLLTAAKETVSTRLKQGVSDAVFSGGGVIGRTLKAKFDEKIGSAKKPRTDESTSDIVSNQLAVLEDIEKIVTNISDNVYNIAGVLGAQLTSMQAAQKESKRRLSISQAQAEETALESNLNADVSLKPEQVEEKKAGSIKERFTEYFKGLKKAAVGLAALGATGIAATAVAKLVEDNEEEDPEEIAITEEEKEDGIEEEKAVPESVEETNPLPAQQTPTPTIVSKPQFSNINTNRLTKVDNAIQSLQIAQGELKSLIEQKNLEKQAVSKRLTILSPDGIVDDPKDPAYPKELKEIDDKYKNLIDSKKNEIAKLQLIPGVREKMGDMDTEEQEDNEYDPIVAPPVEVRKSSTLSKDSSLASIEAEKEDRAQELLTRLKKQGKVTGKGSTAIKQFKATDEYKLLEQEYEQKRQQITENPALIPATPSTLAQPVEKSASPLETKTEFSAASVVTPAPSSGADISAATVDIEAATSIPAPQITVASENNVSAGTDQSRPDLPSPIADRGSLDLGIFFASAA